MKQCYGIIFPYPRMKGTLHVLFFNCFLALSTVGARSDSKRSLENMLPASADIGDSADLYCSVGTDVDVYNIQWFRSNLTHEEEIYSDYSVFNASLGYEITKREFQGVSFSNRHFFNHLNLCPIFKQGGPVNKTDKYSNCATSVLTVTNVTEDDYSMSYICRWREGSYYSPKERSGKILNPREEIEAENFVSCYQSKYSDDSYRDEVNDLHCVANHNSSWFMSCDNQSFAIINEPEKLQTYCIPDNIWFKEISFHVDGMHESLLIIDNNKLLQDIFFYFGTSVESASFVKCISHGNTNSWDKRYHEMWNVVEDYHIWKVCFVIPPLILVAAVIAMARAGLFKICHHHCCLKLATLIALKSQRKGVPYMQFGNIQALSGEVVVSRSFEAATSQSAETAVSRSFEAAGYQIAEAAVSRSFEAAGYQIAEAAVSRSAEAAGFRGFEAVAP